MITLEPTEEGIRISGNPKSLGKAIYQLLTKPSLFFFPKSEWEKAQDFIFKQNEEQEG